MANVDDLAYLFCHVKILVKNIISVKYLFISSLYNLLYMIGLPLWDTVSMNLAQKKCCTP